MQVRVAMPKTPSSWNVLRSAWAPAPPVASDPAMVSVTAGDAEVVVVEIPPVCPSRLRGARGSLHADQLPDTGTSHGGHASHQEGDGEVLGDGSGR